MPALVARRLGTLLGLLGLLDLVAVLGLDPGQVLQRGAVVLLGALIARGTVGDVERRLLLDHDPLVTEARDADDTERHRASPLRPGVSRSSRSRGCSFRVSPRSNRLVAGAITLPIG